MHDLTGNVRGELYRSLVDYAASQCPYFLFVIRDSLRLSQKGLRVINALKDFLVKTESRDSWPGTQLHGGQVAVVNTYLLTPEAVKVLSSASSSLYEWKQPDLPEDLCFLRDDKEPWLVTICHEEDAYFVASEQEVHELVMAIPNLERVLGVSE